METPESNGDSSSPGARWGGTAALGCWSRDGLFGKGLRHVAVHGETWLALVGWQAGAFRGSRPVDRLVGGAAVSASAPDCQQRSFHGAGGRAGCESGLAGSRPEPAPAGRRHAGDAWLSGASGRDDGGPVALGTCYRASKQSLGFTRGFSREPGGSARWRRGHRRRSSWPATHARPVCGRGAGGGLAEPWRRFCTRSPTCPTSGLPDGLACSIIALAGYRASPPSASSRQLNQKQLKGVGAFWSPTRRRIRRPPPPPSTISSRRCGRRGA